MALRDREEGTQDPAATCVMRIGILPVVQFSMRTECYPYGIRRGVTVLCRMPQARSPGETPAASRSGTQS